MDSSCSLSLLQRNMMFIWYILLLFKGRETIKQGVFLCEWQVGTSQASLAPSLVFWFLCSFLTSVWTLLLCTYTPPLRLTPGWCKAECFPADWTLITAACVTQCEWRKWNICLGVWCDGCDPAGCWLSLIAVCFVATVDPKTTSYTTRFKKRCTIWSHSWFTFTWAELQQRIIQCSGQFPRVQIDFFKMLLLSEQQSKTQRLVGHRQEWHRKAANHQI